MGDLFPISALRFAVEHPGVALVGMRNIMPERDADREVVVSRTSRFAETVVLNMSGERFLLSVPLRKEYVNGPAALIEALEGVASPCLDELHLLRDELHYMDSLGRECVADVLVQRLPCGDRLSDAVIFSVAGLKEQLEELQGEMTRLDLTHGNLRPENIIVGEDGHLHPVRYYYARVDDGCQDDFAALYDMVTERVIVESEPDYRELVKTEAAFETYPVQDGMMRVYCQERFFFVDVHSGETLAGRYMWADDFCEGRAVVETESGMGVINRDGEFLIPDLYHDIEYDSIEGVFITRYGDDFVRFDYFGECLDRK